MLSLLLLHKSLTTHDHPTDVEFTNAFFALCEHHVLLGLFGQHLRKVFLGPLEMFFFSRKSILFL